MDSKMKNLRDTNRNVKKASTRNRHGQNAKEKGALSGREELLHVNEMADVFHEPYILSGYRGNTELVTIRQTLHTMFSIHNETINIWSHLVAATVFAVYFWWKFQTMKVDVTRDARGYPLVCFAFGICLVFLSSALAHLFGFISEKANHVCFYFDYGAIGIFTFTACQAFYFCSRPTDPSNVIFNSPCVYLGTSAAISLLTVVLSSLSRHYIVRYRFLMRSLPNVIKILFDTWPFVARIYLCTSSADCNEPSIAMFYRHLLCYLISGVTYATHIPERWMPGVFDFFGHSHHFLHVVTIFGNYLAFCAVSLDVERRSELLANMPIQPTIYTTFGMLLLVVLASACIVGTFTYLCLRDQVNSRKDDVFVSKNHYKVIYSSECNGYVKKES